MNDDIDTELLKPIRRKPSPIERWRTFWSNIFDRAIIPSLGFVIDCVFIPLSCLFVIGICVLTIIILVEVAIERFN